VSRKNILSEAGWIECMRAAVNMEQRLERLFRLPIIWKDERCVELEQRCETRMEHSEKTDACFAQFAVSFADNRLVATLSKFLRLIIDGCSGSKIHYTKDEAGEKVWLSFGAKEIRSTWCTTCAAVAKCANFILRVSATRVASPIR